MKEGGGRGRQRAEEGRLRKRKHPHPLRWITVGREGRLEGRRTRPQAAPARLPHRDQGAQLNYHEHRPEPRVLEIHLSSSEALSRGGIGGGWRRVGEDRKRERQRQSGKHFNRKAVSQVAKGAPRKPQSGLGKGGEIFQPGILHQANLEGSKHRAQPGCGRAALNLGTNVWGRQICLEFHRMRLNWDLRTWLGFGQAGLKTVMWSGIQGFLSSPEPPFPYL